MEKETQDSGNEIPLLDETLCTSCGACPEACPTACLEMAGPIPWLARPGDCISCSVCVLICPVAALQMAALEDDIGARGAQAT